MPLGFAGRLVAAPAPLVDVRLETERLLLRPLGSADAPALMHHLTDHAVSRWLARVPYPYGIADANAFVEHVRLAGLAGTAVTLGLTRRGDPIEAVIGWWLCTVSTARRSSATGSAAPIGARG